MATVYILVKVEYVASFNVNDLLSRVKSDQNIRNAKIVEDEIAKDHKLTPYIAF